METYMHRSPNIIGLLLLTLCLLSIGGNTLAAPISASKAGQIAKQHHGGKVIDVKTTKTSKGTTYRVKILDGSGRIKSVPVDANSGRILK